MTGTISFRFNDQSINAKPGQSVAAALTDAGLFELRGTVSGRSRGIFCGMGVCQDCLVEIDGKANQRACMTKVQSGVSIRRQVALPELRMPEQGAATPTVRHEKPDVLVIGGGAGGLCAAIAARQSGATTLLLDERGVPGGQYFKQTTAALKVPPLDAQQKQGSDLVEATVASGVDVVGEAEVWGAFAGPKIYAAHNGTALIVEPKALIIATGAYERPIIVPGWDLPGVMTTGAAQTLWRSYRTLPGKRIAIFGSGPLNAQVAHELASGGAEISLLAETSAPPWRHPAAVTRLLAAAPGLAWKGLAAYLRLWSAGRGPAFRTRLDHIEESAGGLQVSFRKGDGNRRQIEVDAVCMNNGFQPQNEILRLLGASMHYEVAMDQLRPQRSDTMETSVTGLFAVGDCCGLGGAPAAMEEGRIAGYAAAIHAGATGEMPDIRSNVRRLERHRRFQKSLWQIHDPGAGTLENSDPDTMICRCEEVTLREIEEVIEAGSTEIGSIKRATRLGMGRCQGRYCAPALTLFLSRKTGQPVGDMSFFAPRTPIKPVAIDMILSADEAHGDG